MHNANLLKFTHDGFEIVRPWRDCGADWNQVDPQTYGFHPLQYAKAATYVMQRFSPGVGTQMLIGVVKQGEDFCVQPQTTYLLVSPEGVVLAQATVEELDAQHDTRDETRYAFHVELAIPNSVADKMDRAQLDALADRMLATLEQGRQDNEFGIDMNWMAVIDIEPLGD